MKKYLIHTLGFLLPLILAGVVSLGVMIYANSIKFDYKLEPGISTVFIGDSHIQKAVNDSLFENAINLGLNSESFYFSYFKLEKLLSNNPKIDTVFLGLSYHSFSNYYDTYISGDHSAAIAPKYFYLLPYPEQVKLLEWNKNRLFPFLVSVVSEGFKSILLREKPEYLGGYQNQFDQSGPEISSMDKRLLFQYNSAQEQNPFSDVNITYLDKIIELLDSKGVELLTLNTPLHEYYRKGVPSIYKVKLEEFINSKDLNTIDLSTLNLSDASYIPDGDHVSKRGADESTRSLKEIIHKRKTNN